MEQIKTLVVAGLIVVLCGVGFVKLIQVESATAQNIETIYLDLHQGQ